MLVAVLKETLNSSLFNPNLSKCLYYITLDVHKLRWSKNLVSSTRSPAVICYLSCLFKHALLLKLTCCFFLLSFQSKVIGTFMCSFR